MPIVKKVIDPMSSSALTAASSSASAAAALQMPTEEIQSHPQIVEGRSFMQLPPLSRFDARLLLGSVILSSIGIIVMSVFAFLEARCQKNEQSEAPCSSATSTTNYAMMTISGTVVLGAIAILWRHIIIQNRRYQYYNQLPATTEQQA